jgi:hypothetical protein
MREEVVRGHVPGDAWRGISDNAPKCCFVVYLREAPILPRMRLRLSELATSAPVTLGKDLMSDTVHMGPISYIQTSLKPYN